GGFFPGLAADLLGGDEEVGKRRLAAAFEHVEPYFCALSACDHCVRNDPAQRQTGSAAVGRCATGLGIPAVQAGRSLSIATRGRWAGSFGSTAAPVHRWAVPLGP